MKRRLLFLVLLVALLIAGAFACAKNVDEREALREQGYICVTFDCQGGYIGNYSERTLYLKPGGLVLKPGALSGNTFPDAVRHSFTLIGWFTGSTDGEGAVAYGTQWNFDTDRPQEDVTLYAKWEPSKTITYVAGALVDGVYEFTFSVEVRYNEAAGQYIQAARPDTMSWPGHVFAHIYADAAHTVPIPYPVSIASEDPDELIVYQKTLGSEWTTAYNATDFANPQGGKIYLMNDIDMTGRPWTVMYAFSGTIEGNGYAIKNLTASYSPLGTAMQYFGLFSQLGATAVVRNVTFENLTLTIGYGITGGLARVAGTFAGSVLPGATVENVAFTNASFTFRHENRTTLMNVALSPLFGDNQAAAAVTGFGVVIEQQLAETGYAELSREAWAH